MSRKRKGTEDKSGTSSAQVQRVDGGAGDSDSVGSQRSKGARSGYLNYSDQEVDLLLEYLEAHPDTFSGLEWQAAADYLNATWHNGRTAESVRRKFNELRSKAGKKPTGSATLPPVLQRVRTIHQEMTNSVNASGSSSADW